MNDYILRQSRLDNEKYYKDERNIFNDKGTINWDDTMILNVYAIINSE